MLTTEQIQSFKDNGYLYYGPVLTPEELRDLQTALQAVLAGQSDKDPDALHNLTGDDENVVVQIVNIWQAEPAFERHLYNEKIVRMIAQLTDSDTIRVWHDQIQIKPPYIGGPTLWHQDHPYWPVIQPADLVSAWVAIEDADGENGCMSMVRRSHLWGPINGGTIGSDPSDWGPAADAAWIPEGETLDVVSIPVPAGAVVFHHCLTWHGAPPNRTDRNRPAIAVHYMPGHTRYEPSGAGHIVEHHIEVAAGEILSGDHFPLVLDGGKPVFFSE